MTEEERTQYEGEARAFAQRRFYEAVGFTYTDGLGAMGVGSLEDGPAAIKNAAFVAEWRRLCAEVVGE